MYMKGLLKWKKKALTVQKSMSDLDMVTINLWSND